jgi:hypothetical protein
LLEPHEGEDHHGGNQAGEHADEALGSTTMMGGTSGVAQPPEMLPAERIREAVSPCDAQSMSPAQIVRPTP